MNRKDVAYLFCKKQNEEKNKYEYYGMDGKGSIQKSLTAKYGGKMFDCPYPPPCKQKKKKKKRVVKLISIVSYSYCNIQSIGV
jgi:hypothetical protein